MNEDFEHHMAEDDESIPDMGANNDGDRDIPEDE